MHNEEDAEVLHPRTSTTSYTGYQDMKPLHGCNFRNGFLLSHRTFEP